MIVAVRIVESGGDRVIPVGPWDLVSGDDGPMFFGIALARAVPERTAHEIATLAYRLHLVLCGRSSRSCGVTDKGVYYGLTFVKDESTAA